MRYVTAGESHGPALTAIVSGVPAGVELSQDAIDFDLARRQSGYGRGGRQKIESDTAQVIGGVRFGRTLGSPVCLQVVNADHASWKDIMSPMGDKPAGLERETSPRPGHADLVGTFKTASDDCRDILERASARETAARVAAGAVARAFLAQVGVEVSSYVTSIGTVSMPADALDAGPVFPAEDIEASDVRCPDEQTSDFMRGAIDEARGKGQSLGGIFNVVATGLVPGVGGYASADERLTSRLGAALFSIPAIKGVEFGLGFQAARYYGGSVHDEIIVREGAITRAGNNAGGLEGGMTTGMPLVISAAMKPIPTLTSPLETIDLDTRKPVSASKERSDVCAVPAAAVVAEAEVCMVLADAYLDKFGCDTMTDILTSLAAYKARIA